MRVDVAFERTVLDGLGRILLGPEDTAQAARTLARIVGRLSEIPAIAFKHKVTTVVAQNTKILLECGDARVTGPAGWLSDLLAADLTTALNHRRLLEDELVAISDLLGSRATVLKGFCNARFYPEPYVRWMRDVDVLCASWEDAVMLLNLLLERGYTYDEDESPWVKADEARGRGLYGQIFLIRPASDDFCRVDIHFGTYSVGYSGYLDLDLAEASTVIEVGNQRIRVLKPEACSLIAQSHALSDGYVAIKDINDFVAMATSSELVDWRQVGQRLRQHGLNPQAALLAQHVRRLYSDERVLAAANELLEQCPPPRWTLWRTHDRSWRLRARVNASFAYRWHRLHGDGIGTAAIRLAQCYLFYGRRLRLEVRPRSLRERLLRAAMAEPDLARWRLRADACTLLIDADVVRGLSSAPGNGDATGWQAVAEGIEVSGEAGREYVRLGGRTFVPTLDLLIPPAQAASVPANVVRRKFPKSTPPPC
jgi:hypothetical protein